MKINAFTFINVFRGPNGENEHQLFKKIFDQSFTPTQENVKKQTSTLSGSFPNWESETSRILHFYENEVGHRLPRGELTSRVFHRLSRATIRDLEHLERLLPRTVRQALIDYGREQSRDHELFVYDYAFDFPAPHSVPAIIEERKELLLGAASPLDAFEKSMIHVALEDPVRFIRPDGQPAQRAIGRYFGIDHVTVRNRWVKIMTKVAAIEAAPDLSI